MRIQFRENLDFLEKQIKTNIHQLGMETFANSFYYFCKFQHGQPEFWELMEATLMKNRESLTIEHLTRILLALVMNPRPISEKMAEPLIS
jgi:hypothetical protein